MLEKEVKILLSKEQYETVQKLFDWEEDNTQINVYYSNQQLLNAKQKNTIRIRCINDQKKLQVKRKISESGSLHINREYEQVIDEIPETISGTLLNHLCETTDFTDVTKMGSLKTRRMTNTSYPHTEIALDENAYFDIVDYELEIEYQEELDPKIIEIIEQNGIDTTQNATGKFNRFLNKYFINHSK